MEYNSFFMFFAQISLLNMFNLVMPMLIFRLTIQTLENLTEIHTIRVKQHKNIQKYFSLIQFFDIGYHALTLSEKCKI